MNILVTGANGQLGREIRNASAGSPHRFIFTDVSQAPDVETVYLDITNPDAIRIICRSEDIDVIVNCAAYTDVEKAESDLTFADLLNHTAAAYLATVAKERGATRMTKYAGERSILNSGCRYMIFRTAWLYSPYGKNFVKTMARLTGSNPSIKVVFDQVGTPTYAADLAGLIVRIIDGGMLDRTGVYHFSDEGCISWYDLAVAVNRLYGHGCTVNPCHTDEFPTKARRPKYSVLDKTRVKETFGVTIPYWLDSLEDCISRLKAEK